MADYSVLRMTDVGINLQTKVQAGATLIFSRFGLGSGSMTFPDDVPVLTALVNEQMALAISEIKKISTTQYKISGVITPDNLPIIGFDMTEIGLFATDPDDGEILYGVIYAGATADFIPSSGQAYDYAINLIVSVQDTDNVTVVVDAAAVATLQNIADHEQKQLDPTDTDAVKERHLSNAQGKVWQDHIDRVIDPTDEDTTRNKHLSSKDAKVWTEHMGDTIAHGGLKFEPGFAVDNEVVNIPGLFVGRPGVIVVASMSKMFDPAYVLGSQSIECYHTNLEEYNPNTDQPEAGTKSWRFTMRAVILGATFPSVIVNEPNVVGSQGTSAAGSYTFTWTNYATSGNLTTPPNSVSIMASGSGWAKFTKAVGQWYDALKIEISLEIDGVGEWVIGTYLASGLDVTTREVSGSFSGFTKTFPEGEYTYRYKARAASYTWVAGTAMTLNWSVTNIKSVFQAGDPTEAPFGAAAWYAIGLNGG